MSNSIDPCQNCRFNHRCSIKVDAALKAVNAFAKDEVYECPIKEETDDAVYERGVNIRG